MCVWISLDVTCMYFLYIHIQAVVAGADWTLTHRNLSYATLCLTNIPGCELVATNRDRLVPAADGMKYPGTPPVGLRV